jgi:hypothetical protein
MVEQVWHGLNTHRSYTHPITNMPKTHPTDGEFGCPSLGGEINNPENFNLKVE